jgi:mannan endo-1,4-beta-mannosidase
MAACGEIGDRGHGVRITRRGALAGSIALGLSGKAALARSPATGSLSNTAASAPAKALYRYLWSIYGHKTLTGQQESFWKPEGPTVELDYIRKVSGRLPAVLGLDYIEP